MQRVRVAMTGLASVVVLIGIATVIFSSANKEGPVTAIGAPNADTVANMTSQANVIAAVEDVPDEPLAELGVAPSTAATETVNVADIARALEAESPPPVAPQP